MLFRKNLFIALLIGLASLFTACSKEAPLKDGTYTAESSKTDKGAYAKIILVIKGNQIDNVKFLNYDGKGNLKDENYGKSSGNEAFYKKAQQAVAGMKSFEKQINEKKDLGMVEAVSGATISYNQFKEAMEIALDKARK